MKNEVTVKKISLTVSLIIVTGISLFFFLLGTFTGGFRASSEVLAKKSAQFKPVRYDRPELTYFTTSFCPPSNELETSLHSVFSLLKSKADFIPHFLFQKVSDIPYYCRTHIGSPDNCGDYVKSKFFNNVAECKKTLSTKLTNCLNPANYLKSASGTYYTSILGRQELNQNVRELCAFNTLGDDKTMWWEFVTLVNKNCTAENADTCWEDQALKAGLNPNKITTCFNQNAFTLIEQEILAAARYQVQGAPAVVINSVRYPSDSPLSFSEESGATLINGLMVSKKDYRHPNTLKSAVCASFKRQPSVCKNELPAISGLSTDNQGCSNL